MVPTGQDPEPVVNTAIWVMAGLATVFFVARICCKISYRQSIWWDDHLLIVAWVCLIISNALKSTMMATGYGKPGVEATARALLIHQIGDTFTSVSVVASKASFAATILRLTSIASQGWRRAAVWLIIVSVSTLILATAVLSWVENCEEKSQDKPENRIPVACVPRAIPLAFSMAANSYSAFTDFLLTIVAWTIVWRLQMRTHEKIGVGLALSIGLLAGLVTIIKIWQTQVLMVTPPVNMTYRLAIMYIYNQSEPCATIIAVSIPALRVVARDAVSFVVRTHYSSSSGAGVVPSATPSHTGGGGGGVSSLTTSSGGDRKSQHQHHYRCLSHPNNWGRSPDNNKRHQHRQQQSSIIPGPGLALSSTHSSLEPWISDTELDDIERYSRGSAITGCPGEKELDATVAATVVTRKSSRGKGKEEEEGEGDDDGFSFADSQTLGRAV